MQGRGGSPGFRFTLYAVLSVVVMFLDQREHYLEHVRYVLQAAAYPIQLAVNSPPAAWRWLKESFQTREALQAENARLRAAAARPRAAHHALRGAGARERRAARPAQALPPVADRWLPAEIVNIQLSSLRQRLLHQPRRRATACSRARRCSMTSGLLGQTTHVGPWSAEVILITDPEHAVPVQIERTGLRTIAVGAGDTASLALPYLPANADVKNGRPAGDLGSRRRVPGGLPGGARHRGAPRRGAAAGAGARRPAGARRHRHAR